MIMGVSWAKQYVDIRTTIPLMADSDLVLTASQHLTATTMQPCSRASSDRLMDPDLVPRLVLHIAGQKSDLATCLARYV